jgi:hypothetical protein
MYEREKSRSAKNQGAHKSAKFKAKKERESANAKSFSQEREKLFPGARKREREAQK